MLHPSPPTIHERRLPLIVGHSHVRALGVRVAISPAGLTLIPVLRDAVPAIDDPLDGSPAVDARYLGISGAWPIDPERFDEFAQLARGRIVFVLWEGNQHLSSFLFAPSVPFDFMLRDNPALSLSDEVTLLPYAAVKEYFRSDGLLDEFLSRLRSAPDCRPILVGTPPPKKDNDFLKSIMLSERYWIDAARSRGEELRAAELSDPLLRLKLWAVLQALLEEAADRHGIPFAPVPPEVQDEAGFLARRFYGSDATHAWGEYGAIVRDRLHALYVTDA